MSLTKKKLEILLEKLEPFQKPKVSLEQYTIPSNIAAEVLYYAYLKGDVEGKVVYDLGCGTGRLAIGCALLNAKEVIGIDADEEALDIAKKNANKLALNIKWTKCSIKDIKGKADTVVQNPPFGVKKKKADRIFLEKAFEVGKVIYSMHKAETREFIMQYIKKLGGRVTDVTSLEFALPYSYKFHRKEMKKILVDVFRIERRKQNG
jgi:putative methylase